MEELENTATMFNVMIYSLSLSAMQQLGKVESPFKGMKKDVQQAKYNLDMLKMFLEKTAGNLSTDEQNMLVKAIADIEVAIKAEG